MPLLGMLVIILIVAEFESTRLADGMCVTTVQFLMFLFHLIFAESLHAETTLDIHTVLMEQSCVISARLLVRKSIFTYLALERVVSSVDAFVSV